MLKKLLKYDLEWCYKPLLVFYILAIFFSIIVRIVESFEQSLIVLSFLSSHGQLRTLPSVRNH